MNRLNINAIINFLNEKDELKDIEIFSEIPVKESKWLQMIVNFLPVNINSAVEKLVLLNCSLSWGSIKYSDVDIIEYLEIVEEILTNDYSWGVKDFGFGVHKITLAWTSEPMTDDKLRNIRTKDFYLYYRI